MTNASKANIAGQEFFRLTETATSSGDIFEIDIAATTIAVGPESDFSRYDIFYLDENNVLRKMLVSVDQPLTLTVQVNNAQNFPGTNIPARLIVIPNEIYMPESLSDEGNNVLFPPVIDLLFFTGTDPVAVQRRSPKLIRTPIRIASSANNQAILIPTYGRDRVYASVVRMTELSSGGDSSEPLSLVSAHGIKFMFPVVTAITVGITGTFPQITDRYVPPGTPIAFPTGVVNRFVGGLMDTQIFNLPFIPDSASTAFAAHGRYDYVLIQFAVTDGSGPLFDPGLYYMGGIQVYLEAYDGG